MPTTETHYEQLNSILDAARAYVRRGWRVFPLHSIRNGACTCKLGSKCEHPGKHPRTTNGCLDASIDETTIRQWWHKWPDANIGIATGHLYVVDADTHKGAKLSDLGDIPETLTVKTGGGGFQFYFSIDPDLKLGNTANKLGQWIDT